MFLKDETFVASGVDVKNEKGRNVIVNSRLVEWIGFDSGGIVL